ncbi:MAG: hypothetical protein KAQ71_20515, partial [Desulfobulbaceae bacterium]|nr:hypothetical protein [Desulfobulbaceae bacterium]
MPSITLTLPNILIIILVAALSWLFCRSYTKKRGSALSSPSEKRTSTQKSMQAPISGSILSNIDTYSSNKNSFQKDIETSCALFLNILYRALDLNSVALLKGDPESRKVFLNKIITEEMDILDDT